MKWYLLASQSNKPTHRTATKNCVFYNRKLHHPTFGRAENWRTIELFSVRFQFPPHQTKRSDFHNRAFLLTSPKVYVTYRYGNAFRLGNTLSCNHCINLRYCRVKHYSTLGNSSFSIDFNQLLV